MGVINAERARRGSNGLSINMNASTNSDLREMKRKIVERIATVNPQWKEEFDTFKSDDERAKAIHQFRKAATSPLFNDRVEIDFIRNYISTRDLIAEELQRRELSTGNPDRGLLSHKTNDDLKEMWIRFRLDISSKPDFAGIFTRYFDSDDSISRVSWPSSYMVTKTQDDIERLSA